VREGNEVCDGNCPIMCLNNGCQLNRLEGAASTCNSRCVSAGNQTQCRSGDNCCPAGCNANNDNNCSATCGNNVREGSEVCDGNCPTSCPNNGCTKRRLNGTGCGRSCVDDGRVCVADGTCCSGCTGDPDCGSPDGMTCNAASDCTSGVCGSFYEDKDRDGYGGALKRVCGSSPPAGHVTRGGDCCDIGSHMYPGSPLTSYYSTIFCNSGDINCDGVETMITPQPAWNPNNTCANGATSVGWITTPPTNCRQEGVWAYCRNNMMVTEMGYPGCY